jgi:hypothetical protein
MDRESFNLHDLENIPELLKLFKLNTISSYDEFIEQLYQDIDSGIVNLEQNKNYISDNGNQKSLSEDQISLILISFLNGKNYDASHDTNCNGHCDILIKKKNYANQDYFWLGEAKIHGSYNDIEKGFEQLCWRYSTGTTSASNGGVIIYIKTNDAANVIRTWRDRLATLNLPNYTNSDCNKRPQLAFYSTHKHESSGLDYRVRHMGVVLHFNPIDRKRKSKKN